MFYKGMFWLFSRTCKPLNSAKASRLLLDVKSILDENNIEFFLVFGTLLGAHRDNDFIAHDTDIDIAILDTSDNAIAKLRNSGVFAEKNILFFRGRHYSLTRDGVYMDIYIFSENDTDYRCANYKIPKEHFPLGGIRFLDSDFKAPRNITRYLEDEYGPDWKTPVIGKHT